jgi:predicted Zn finger-like uncharacterized protein
MLVNCNSCQKKFTVPDAAISESGRLLQCGSCGNKWTQYPIKKESINEEKPIKEITKITQIKTKQAPKINKIKTSIKKKREINLYSKEYLKKRHGLTIKDTSENKKNKSGKNTLNSSSFFIYLITTSIFIIAIFGVLNLTKDFLIINYSFTETYIYSFYEVLEILKASIINLLN